jgi:hypothetical protein
MLLMVSHYRLRIETTVLLLDLHLFLNDLFWPVI